MFYGQYNLDQVIFERFFKNKKNGFFVECGAFDGETESTCKFFEESLSWTGINIEPVPYAYNKLIINRPNCININAAISDKNDILNFTNAIHPILGLNFGNGSLAHSAEHKKSLIDEGCIFERFDVNVIKFFEIWDKHHQPEIDLFVLDVEGHEINALYGILEIPNLFLPKVFCIEDTICNKDQLNMLLSLDYSYHSSHAHNAFYIKK